MSGAGGCRLELADGLLADIVGVGCPGGFVLGGGAHADGAAGAGGARTSGPARRWRARAVSMSCQGPWSEDGLGLVQGSLSASARARPEGVPPWSPRRRLPRPRPGLPRSGRDRYRAPRSQVVHQARQVSTGSFSLPDGRLLGARGQVGAHWPAGGLPADDPPRAHVSGRRRRRPTRRRCAHRRGYLPVAGECRRPAAHPGRRPRSGA